MSSWWDRHVVPRMIGYCCRQPPIMERRRLVVPMAHGQVLELGAGGGANFALYDRARVVAVTGIDPSDALIALAAAAIAPKDRDFLRIEKGVAEDLPFPDGSFDTLVTTFTLCSVHDHQQALKEARRVLKPGGQLLFLEHGLAPDASTQRWQRRLEPFWKPFAGGCHLTRPVTPAIAAAGFRVAQEHGAYMDNTPRFAGWVEWGAASSA